MPSSGATLVQDLSLSVTPGEAGAQLPWLHGWRQTVRFVAALVGEFSFHGTIQASRRRKQLIQMYRGVNVDGQMWQCLRRCPAGHSLLIMGPSGAGKTSILRCGGCLALDARDGLLPCPGRQCYHTRNGLLLLELERQCGAPAGFAGAEHPAVCRIPVLSIALCAMPSCHASPLGALPSCLPACLPASSRRRTVAGLWNSGSGHIVRHGQPMGRAEGEVSGTSYRALLLGYVTLSRVAGSSATHPSNT